LSAVAAFTVVRSSCPVSGRNSTQAIFIVVVVVRSSNLKSGWKMLYLALFCLISILTSPSIASPALALKYARGPPRNAAEKLARDGRLEELGLLSKRTQFPDNPPSCKLCEKDYANIQSCANASVVFSQPSSIIFAPQQFIDVINCACTDTFKSAYPQCVDCFTQTNQTGFLVPQNGNLSSVVTGMRQICGMLSALFGGVASQNSQLPGQTPITVSDSSASCQRAGAFDGVRGPAFGMIVALVGVAVGGWTVFV